MKEVTNKQLKRMVMTAVRNSHGYRDWRVGRAWHLYYDIEMKEDKPQRYGNSKTIMLTGGALNLKISCRHDSAGSKGVKPDLLKKLTSLPGVYWVQPIGRMLEISYSTKIEQINRDDLPTFLKESEDWTK